MPVQIERLVGGAAAAVTCALVVGCGPDLVIADGARIACTTDDGCPPELRCASAIGLCVEGDGPAPPVIASVTSTFTTAVSVVFNQPMHAPTLASASYGIEPALAVQSVQVAPDGTAVSVMTAPQVGGRAYRITIVGVLDAWGNALAGEGASADFAGYGPAADTLAPTALAPTAGAYLRLDEGDVDAHNVTLEWSARQGAHEYLVEVTTNAEQPAAIPGSPFRVVEPVTSLTLTLSADETYFWRVRADTTSDEAWGSSNFAIIGDRLHVYCPATLADCSRIQAVAQGGRGAPLRSIQEALDLAQALGVREIRVAGRGGAAVYDEGLVLVGGGVDLRGGYAADFGSADPAAQPTVVHALGPAAALTDIRMPTLVEDMTFVSEDENAVVIGTASDGLTIDGCTIATQAHGTSAAALIIGAGLGTGPLVRGSTLTSSGAAALVYGFLLGDGAARLEASTIRVSGGSYFAVGVSAARGALLQATTSTIDVSAPSYSFGVELLGAQALLEANTIAVSGEQYLTGIQVLEGAELLLRRNQLFVVGADVSASYTAGIQCQFSGDPGAKALDAANNIIVVIGQSAEAIYSQDAAAAASSRSAFHLTHNTIVTHGPGLLRVLDLHGDESVTNNLLYCDGAPHGATSIALANAELATGGSIQNNVIAGCTMLYGTFATTVADVAALNGLDGTGSDCAASRIAGNSTTSLALTELFVDAAGPDGVLATPTDDDFHLSEAAASAGIASAGRDTAAVDCGACSGLVSCGGTTTDFAGSPRTLPPSPGAYEKD